MGRQWEVGLHPVWWSLATERKMGERAKKMEEREQE
jgi:hypothetical protein